MKRIYVDVVLVKTSNMGLTQKDINMLQDHMCSEDSVVQVSRGIYAVVNTESNAYEYVMNNECTVGHIWDGDESGVYEHPWYTVTEDICDGVTAIDVVTRALAEEFHF